MAEKQYIERDRIVKFIEDGLNDTDKTKAFGHDAVEILAEIHLAPAADVAPVVHAEWIVTKTEHGWNCAEYPVEYMCSVCGRTEPQKEPYCPNCGADMRGVDSGSK